jgi:hypothetical protein
LAVFCPNCGIKSLEGSTFCHNCGADLRPFIGQKELSYSQISDDIKKYSAYRTSTDKIVSPLWLLVPISSLAISYYSVVTLILTLESFFSSLPPAGTAPPTPPALPLSLTQLSILEGISLIPYVLFLYFMYILVKRRNLHFERQNRLFYAIFLTLGMAVSKRSDLSRDVHTDLSSINSELQSSRYRETEKSAILWVILLIVPIIGTFAYFYIFYFLANDFQEHEVGEDFALSNISRVLRSIGISFSYDRSFGTIRYSSFWLYFILDIVTLGLFGIYWMYLLINGPNMHFRNQAKIEDALISSIPSPSV